MSLGSVRELEYMGSCEELIIRLQQVAKMIYGLISTLKSDS